MADAPETAAVPVTPPVAQPLGVFTQGILSGQGGYPSSTRTLMFAFSLFAMVILGVIVHHMVKLTDIGALSLWLSSFPMIVTVLIGLVVTPYTVARGTGTVSDIFNAISSSRAPKQ